MPKKQLETLSEPMFYILLALKKERHGYEIIKYVEGLTKGRVCLGAGTTYSLLGRFENEGIIERKQTLERKKTYLLTQKGADLLDTEITRMKALIENAERGEEI